MTENSSDNKKNDSKSSKGRSRRRRGGRNKKTGDKTASNSTEKPASRNSKSRKKSGKKGNATKPSPKKSEPSAKALADLKAYKHQLRSYDIAIFDSFQAAHNSLEQIKEKTSSVDQLNVVIRAEGDMDDAVLNAIDKVKVFAGTAWALIHDRRIEDGWYKEPR